MTRHPLSRILWSLNLYRFFPVKRNPGPVTRMPVITTLSLSPLRETHLVQSRENPLSFLTRRSGQRSGEVAFIGDTRTTFRFSWRSRIPSNCNDRTSATPTSWTCSKNALTCPRERRISAEVSPTPSSSGPISPLSGFTQSLKRWTAASRLWWQRSGTEIPETNVSFSINCSSVVRDSFYLIVIIASTDILYFAERGPFSPYVHRRLIILRATRPAKHCLSIFSFDSTITRLIS